MLSNYSSDKAKNFSEFVYHINLFRWKAPYIKIKKNWNQ